MSPAALQQHDVIGYKEPTGLHLRTLDTLELRTPPGPQNIKGQEPRTPGYSGQDQLPGLLLFSSVSELPPLHIDNGDQSTLRNLTVKPEVRLSCPILGVGGERMQEQSLWYTHTLLLVTK
ncbi:unnamed protein product [Caretta caretta]